MQRPHPLTSIRWQLPLSYALIALVAALSLSTVLINLLRQHYAQQELALLNRTGNILDNIIVNRTSEPFTSETVPLELTDLSAFFDVRIEALDPQMTLLSDTGIPQSFTVTMATVGDEAVQTFPVEPRRRPSLVISGGEFRAMPAPLSSSGVATTMDATMTISTGSEMASLSNTTVMQFAPAQTIAPYLNGQHNFFGQGGFFEQNNVFQPHGRAFETGVLLDRMPVQVSVNSGRVMLIESQERSEQQIVVNIVSWDTQTPLGFLRLSALPAIGTEIVNSVAQAALIAGTAAILLAAGAGYFFSQRLTAPLGKLETAAHDMAAGEYWVRADVKRRDELGKLADAFNGMAQQVESTVTALRRFVADAAHELHTPLTALRADLELAREMPAPDRVTHALRQATRLEALCDDLLDLSRLESPTLFWQTEAAPVDMGEIIQDLGEVYASRAEQCDIEFTLEVMPTLPPLPTGSPSQMRRALGNLLDNALKFTPAGGHITFAAASSDCGLDIHITDSGIGIPPAEVKRVFDHFYRGSNTHDYPGSGLGLAITNAIVKAHNGRVEVDSDGGGTHFSIMLPTTAQ